GIGRELMKELIAECRRRGFHSLIACITAENTVSCAFHERLGFVRVSHFKEVGYKSGRKLDVVDYQLIL
ncbi:MAG: GNAT family N-acetyltransferase, partial [Muribaculaceae bacterium]|nr:GNAT family N-acetyltransferase [Muribaculaceae bacterium]